MLEKDQLMQAKISSVILMTDADVDGAHIELVTHLFFRQIPDLIEKGMFILLNHLFIS